jgi:hypothetical protein
MTWWKSKQGGGDMGFGKDVYNIAAMVKSLVSMIRI